MKKKYYLLFLLVGVTSSFLMESSLASADNLPWKEGQIVAGIKDSRDDPLYHYYVYRVFIKKVAAGYLVQEFYKDSNKKGTDPFILKNPQDVDKLPYAYFTNLVSKLSIEGSFVIWYENGQKMQEGQYVNGKKDGLWSRWYDNGQKWAEGVTKQGKLEGLWQLWRPDGSKMNELYYRDGKLETILSDFAGAQNGKKGVGDKNLWLEVDDKGHLRSQAILDDGKKEGLWVSWDDKGRKEMLGHYKNDKREGVWQTFWLDANETKKSEGYYKKGKKDGLWVFWDKQGNKVKEEFYQEGKLIKKDLTNR